MGIADLLGSSGKFTDRARNGSRQIQRQQHRNGQGDAENLQNIDAHAVHGCIDFTRILGQHQHAQHLFVALHRGGDAQDHSIVETAHRGSVLTAKRMNHLGIIRCPLNRVLPVFGQLVEPGN